MNKIIYMFAFTYIIYDTPNKYKIEFKKKLYIKKQKLFN